MKVSVMLAAAALVAVSGAASANQALAQKNACMSCHQVDKKVVGPAFKDVAKKYKGDAGAEARLVDIAMHGGNKGVWGNVPMTLGTKPSEADAKAIVKWILSLE